MNENNKFNNLLMSYVLKYISNNQEEKYHESIKDNSVHYFFTKKGIRKGLFSKEYKNRYELNSIQKEVLISLMLSDGHLEW